MEFVSTVDMLKARIEELEAALDDEMMLRNQYLEAENSRLREALVAIASDTDMFGKHSNATIHEFARAALTQEEEE